MFIIKFMFDWGANDTCIWSVNKEAEEQIGDGILGLEHFSLSNELKSTIENLCTEYQTALNWNEPQAGIIWSKEQIDDFKSRAEVAYQQFVASINVDIIVENWIDTCF